VIETVIETVSPKEAAIMAKCHYRTILEWIESGHLPAIQPRGRRGRYLIRKIDLVAILSPPKGQN